MTKTATFSNGEVETYNGKREVSVAWAIIMKSTGETLRASFSANRKAAEKTIEFHLRYLGGVKREFVKVEVIDC